MKIYSEIPKGIERLDGVAPPEPQRSFLTDLSATIRTESDISMLADKLQYYTDYGEPEEGYNPYRSGLIPKDMDQYWEEFKDDHNSNQTMLTVGRLRDLQNNRKIRDEAGTGAALLGYSVAGMGSSTTIPFMLMPAGMLFKGGTALKGAMNIGKSAAQVAGLGAVEESLAEYFRHELDPHRTMAESYMSVGSVSLFGGVLGGFGAKMTNAAHARALRDIEELKSAEKAATEEGGLKRWLANEDDTAGAQKVKSDESVPDKLGWIGSKLLGGGMFPGVRLFTSPAKSVRKVADKLINHAWGSKRSSAENNIRRTEMVARARTRIIGTDGHKKAVSEGYEHKLDRFYSDVGEALIHSDKHTNKHVAETAKKLREEIIEPIKAKFQKLGDLPEELETKFADSYFPRLYKEEVLRESIVYRDRLKNHLLEKHSDLDDAEALSLADDYMQKIEHWDVSKLPQGVGSTGRLKERGIDLFDDDLQRLGFLEKDAMKVLEKYINSVVPEMEIKIAFGGIERAEELALMKKSFKETEVKLKEEFEERLKDPKALREQSREEIEMDFEDYMYFAKEEYKSEKEAIKTIYKGRMEDARIEYDKIRNKIEAEFKVIKDELLNIHETSQTVRRTKRDIEIEKTQTEFESVEAILRKDFANLRTTTEVQKVKAQNALTAKIRAARKVRDADQKKIKTASEKKETELKDAYAKEKEKIDARLDEELSPHTKIYDDTTNETGIKQRAASKESKTIYENNQDKLRKERDRDYKKAQKEKVGSEAAIRRQKRMTLRQQKIAMKKKKKEIGGGTHLLKKPLDEIEAEYDVLIKQAKTQKEINALIKRRENDTNDIHAMRDRLLGIYKRPAGDAKHLSNLGKHMRTWSYLAYMGAMTIASIPDMARTVMKHGVGASWKGFRGGFPSFIKGLDAGSATQREALNHMGISVDALLSSRALMMGDIGDLTGRSAIATKVFTKLTLMNRWNDALKHVSAISAQHRFLNQIKNYDSLSAGRRLQLEEHGFDAEMVDIIRSESTHFSTIKGALMANTNDWADRPAAEHFEKMLLRDTEISIVTPGVGDSPLMMSHDMSKLIFQFKSFFLASHTRAFLPMLRQMSRGDANAFIGLMIQTALGAFVVEPVRLLASGKWDETAEMNWQDWAYAGMDRSGIATLPMELFNLTDKVAQGAIGELLNLRSSRYNQRGLQISGGPGIGLYEEFLKSAYAGAVSPLGDREWTERDTARFRSLIPAQNLFYSRWFFNMAEDAVNDMTDAKE